jgi:hypothetical protein
VVLAHDQYVSVGVVRQLARHAAQKPPLETPEPSRSDHDEVGTHVLGDVDENLGRIAFACLRCGI